MQFEDSNWEEIRRFNSPPPPPSARFVSNSKLRVIYVHWRCLIKECPISIDLHMNKKTARPYSPPPYRKPQSAPNPCALCPTFQLLLVTLTAFSHKNIALLLALCVQFSILLQFQRSACIKQQQQSSTVAQETRHRRSKKENSAHPEKKASEQGKCGMRTVFQF
jgi:hypothetical protein